MDLSEITTRIGDFTNDSILVTEAEPIDGTGPRILWCNAAFTRMTGYALDDIRGRTPRILQGPETDRATLDRVRAALVAWQPIVVTLQNYARGGAPFHVEMSLQPVADDTGFYRYWVAVQRDVTARVERERSLAARNAALTASESALKEEKIRLAGIAAVAQHAQDMITICDPEFRILWANPAFVARSGYTAAAVRGAHHCDLLDKRGEVYAGREAAVRAIVDGTFQDGEVRNVDRHGTEYWTDLRVSVQRDDTGRPERLVVIERDVTDQRRQRLALDRSRRDVARVATRDPLTGLANRRGLEGAFARMAAAAEAAGHGLALFHVDLDRFKEINDTLGHAAGDTVLRAVTERIEAFLGPEALAARVGGDEFVVLVAMPDRAQDMGAYATALLAHVASPVAYGRATCRFGASIGYVVAATAPFHLDGMMMEADLALYRVKDAGRNGVQAFTPDLAAQARERRTLSDELVEALERGQILPHYQPQFGAVTGALAGAEALARWQHPRLGLIGPEKFLALARDLGLEPQIDRAIMRAALDDLARLDAAGLALPRVSVNVSARRLRCDSIVGEIDRIGPPARRLAFELVESIFLDDDDRQVLWTLDALRERGIGIEIDDFGTGHASIMGLVRVRPDRLKIDRSLVGPAALEPARRRLLELITEIGHTLEIAVTAEGIESDAHAEIARGLGCSLLQGYHLGAPMPFDALRERFGTSAAVA